MQKASLSKKSKECEAGGEREGGRRPVFVFLGRLFGPFLFCFRTQRSAFSLSRSIDHKQQLRVQGRRRKRERERKRNNGKGHGRGTASVWTNTAADPRSRPLAAATPATAAATPRSPLPPLLLRPPLPAGPSCPGHSGLVPRGLCQRRTGKEEEFFFLDGKSKTEREREREEKKKALECPLTKETLSLSLSLSFSLSLSLSLSQFDAALNCSQKLVVTLAVESGSSLATTSLDFDVACVLVKSGSSSSGTATPSSPSPSPTATPCPCPCRYGADAGCSCQDLSTPLRVSVTKTPTYATYPLTYIRPFNYGARETVISTGTGWPSLTCDAGSLSSNPTCGWATTGTGLLVSDRVPDSQGFCCDCSLDQLGSGTFGGGSTQGEKRVFGGGGGGGGGGKSGENEKRGREKRR